MAHRINYWTCSKFADYIRGTCKPSSATSGGWNTWKKEAKLAHPVRFWIAEEGLDIVQDILNYPTDKIWDARCYIKNRYVTRSHALTSTTLKRGQWCDLDHRILHCLFEELVNFVEIEKAWMNVVFDDEEKKKYPKKKWYQLHWRNADAGLAHLGWEMGLINDSNSGYSTGHEDFGKPTHQAIGAKEIYELYNWWVNERPKRKDPHDESGWSAWCDKRRAARNSDDPLDFLDHDDETPEERAHSHELINISTRIEEEQFDEDTEMLTRLIKIRRSLWT